MTKAETNRKYWQRRFLQVKASQLKNTEEYERALQPELNGLRKQLQGDIATWTTKYANSNGMTKDEAKKSLDGIKTKDWNLTLKQFEAKAKKGGYEDELNSEYYRSRIARLRELEGQLKQHTSNFAGGQTKSMGKALADQYNDTYMRSTFNTQMAHANITSNFARFSPEQLQMVASKPWKGSNFSQRIWSNYRDKMPSLLMNHLLKGTLLGYSPDKITRNIHAGFQDIKRNDVHRLVVSEMGHIAEEASAKAYEENEIEKYEYMATLESHTCEICGALDGLRFAVKDRKPGVNYPIIHPRCRCTTVPYMDDLPDLNERWSRDPETGQSKLVKNIKYDDWKDMIDGNKPIPEITKVHPLTGGVKPITASSGIKDSNPNYSDVTTGNLDDNDESALRSYYQGGAYDVNGRLREGGKVADDSFATEIASAINKNQVKTPTTVYRKVKSGDLMKQTDEYIADNPELAFPELKAGDTFTDKGFMSTSKSNKLDRFNADSDMFEGDTELHIELPKGVKAVDLQPIADKGLAAGYTSEQEVLLQHGMKFKVTSIETKPLPYERMIGKDQYNSPIMASSIKVVHMQAIVDDVKPSISGKTAASKAIVPKPTTIKPVATPAVNRAKVAKIPATAPKITNPTDFKNYLQKDLGYKKVAVHNMEPRLLQSMADSMAKTYAEYPEMNGWIDSFVSQTSKIEFKAQFESLSNGEKMGNHLIINPKYFDNYDSIMKSINSDVESGFTSKKTTPGGLITHELGHAIDHRAKAKSVGINQTDGLDFDKGWSFHHDSSLGQEIRDFATEKFGDKVKSISKYANKDEQEFIAEAISDESDNKVSEWVRKELKRRLKS